MIPLLHRYGLRAAKLPTIAIGSSRNYASNEDSSGLKDEDDIAKGHDYRVLDLYPNANAMAERKQPHQFRAGDHRHKRMKETQDWGAVWSGPKSFHPSVVPFPIRQGYVRAHSKVLPPPDGYGNAELMKIPNFLHLTPPAVKKQCEAIKRFCTPWPENLETDAKCEHHFPIEFITSDYCHGLPTIRNPLARIIALQYKLSSLKLDAHARDKYLRLVAERYDRQTDIVTITVDRCPTRKQNFEYAQYLITALYHESHIREPWEEEKLEADMEYYDWDKNVSKKTIETILRWGQPADAPIPSTDDYAKSVEALLNEDESLQTIDEYKKQVVKILGLQKEQVHSHEQ